jgi:hypothetical protein
MDAFADHYPASCYPELISPFPIHRTVARHFGQRPATPRDLEQNQNGCFVGDPFQWRQKTTPTRSKKGILTPVFAQIRAVFWPFSTIFWGFLRHLQK